MFNTRSLARGLATLGVVAGLCTATVAQALPVVGPFTPGFIGPLDDRAAILVGAHAGDSSVFYDVFAFTVGGTAGLFGMTFNIQDVDASIAEADEATILGIALYDSVGTVLAADGDGSDGFSMTALLPAAGGYAMAIVGVGGAGAGLYAGLLASESIGVAIPGTAVLALGALLLLGLGRRRSGV